MFKVFSRSTKISSHKTKINNKTIQISENGLKIKLIQWLIFVSFHAPPPPSPSPLSDIVLMILKDSSNINLPVLSPLNFLTKMVSDFFNFTIK